MIIKVRFNGVADTVDLIDIKDLEDVLTQVQFINATFTPLHPGTAFKGFKVIDIAGLGLTASLLAPLNASYEVMYQMAEAVEMILSYYSIEALEAFIDVFGRLPSDFGQFIALFGGVHIDPAAFVQRERDVVLPGMPSFDALQWDGSCAALGYANQDGEIANTARVH